MAKYESHYRELSFYVEGERKQFVNGVFHTENKAEITVLDALNDVKRTDVKEVKAEAKPKAKTKAPAN